MVDPLGIGHVETVGGSQTIYGNPFWILTPALCKQLWSCFLCNGHCNWSACQLKVSAGGVHQYISLRQKACSTHRNTPQTWSFFTLCTVTKSCFERLWTGRLTEPLFLYRLNLWLISSEKQITCLL